MTLHRRLMLTIGLSFALLWGLTTAWMFHDMRSQLRATLDQRLAASAQMVASLVVQLPGNGSSPPVSPTLLSLAARDAMACEIRALGGQVVARTGNSPPGLNHEAPGFVTRVLDGERWRSYTLELDGKRITTADRVDMRLTLLRRILLSQLVPFVVALGGGLVVLWFAVRRALRPLEDIRQAVARRAPDTLSPLATGTVPAELAPLVGTINMLLDRTRAAMERERRFTGDAAHELRTPLTAVKTHIQVARMTAQDAATSASLQQAESGVQRLQHTLEQLLTLARMEGAARLQDGELAGALEIAESAINEFPAPARERIVLENRAGGERLGLPRILLTTALRNLLDNALRYSAPESPVLLRLESVQGGLRFSVLDQGPGMPDEDREQALRRFWRKGQGQGSGLGLSIADVIARRLGGSLTLASRAEGGTIAAVTMPAANRQAAAASAQASPLAR